MAGVIILRGGSNYPEGVAVNQGDRLGVSRVRGNMYFMPNRSQWLLSRLSVPIAGVWG